MWQSQQNDLSAQQTLRSAWSFAQSDQVFAVRLKQVLGHSYP